MITVQSAIVLTALLGTTALVDGNSQRYGAVIYLSPDRPETSAFMMSELPSYLFMPGAPLALSGVNWRPASVSGVSSRGGDLDCSDIAGPVFVGSYDPNGLDGDNDGIGCE